MFRKGDESLSTFARCLHDDNPKQWPSLLQFNFVAPLLLDVGNAQGADRRKVLLYNLDKNQWKLMEKASSQIQRSKNSIVLGCASILVDSVCVGLSAYLRACQFWTCSLNRVFTFRSCHGSTGPRCWVLWVLCLKTCWAQLLDNVQALDVGLPSVLRESGTNGRGLRGA